MHLRNFFNSNCVSAALQRQTDVFDAKFVKEHKVLFEGHILCNIFRQHEVPSRAVNTVQFYLKNL